MNNSKFQSDLPGTEELMESQEKFKTILENLNDTIGILDKDGRFIYINSNNEQVTGWTQEEILGKPGMNLVHSDDNERMMKKFEQLVNSQDGTSVADEFRYLCKDNNYRKIAFIGTNLINNPSVKGILLHFHDVTELKQAQKSKDKEAKRYRTLIESTNDLIWSVDPIHFGIITYNTACENYFNTNRGIQLHPGMTVSELMPHDKVDDWNFMYQRALNEGIVTVDYLTADGEQHLRLTICPMVVGEETIGISVFGQNQTHLKKLEVALKSEIERYSALMESTEGLIWVVEPNNWRLTLFNTAFTDFFEKYYNLKPKAGMTPYEMVPEKSADFFSSLYVKAANQGKFTLDYEAIANKLHFVFRVSPLWVEGKLFGVSIFAEDTTDKVLYKNALEASNQMLSRRLEGALNSISKIGELRDVYTAGHQKRVEKLSCAIAREMKLPEEEIANISMAARIHDIGKIYIASEILNKPGKITDLEYQFIQTHPQHGFDIASEIDFPQDIPAMILQHHEKMDGSGYPHKLVKNQLLMGSRIISVADTVEAMSAHRPYRPALGIGAALDEIIKYKSIKYDENVVEACVRLFHNNQFDFD